jgi:MYXO-CTERM domain-containing protein
MSAVDRAGAVAAGLVAAFVALAAPAPASAYVRYETKTGVGFFWPQSCVPLFAYPASMKDAGGNMDMTTDQIMHAANASAAAWGADANACSYLRIVVTAPEGATPPSRLDYTNALVFRPDSWGYASEALAITSVFVNKQSGAILDGDIEVNVKFFSWADIDLDPMGKGKQDLQNALTHEMGHLIGLDHTCYVLQVDEMGNVISRPNDNLGNPVPDCVGAPAAVQATTMFASATPGDTEKRTLEPDDIAGVCAIYPVANDPMRCPAKDEPPPKSGCAVAAGGPALAGGAWAALALAVVLAARRRRRR